MLDRVLDQRLEKHRGDITSSDSGSSSFTTRSLSRPKRNDLNIEVVVR